MSAKAWVCLFALSATVSEAASNYSYRLPGDIVPELYDLRIVTNIADLDENFTFYGDVAIKVNIVSATDRIFLHSRSLTIDESKVRVFKNKSNAEPCRKKNLQDLDIPIKGQSYHTDLDYYILDLGEKLEAGQSYVVCVPFEGELTPGLAGYYRSSYKDKASGETRWLAVTQFQSTDARKAFPCFDEPAMKAKFKVTLGHIMNKSAISNMPIASSEPMEGVTGWVWDSFEATVPMSTYLLAYMVSDLEYELSSNAASNNVTFRVWARKDALPQVKYAAEIGPKILEDFEKYFDIKYPLPKQDMVAVPDFSNGGMENWGLINYRESALLFDPNYTTATEQVSVVGIIAHELAHQWFGNLVTMRWWTDLWLNEGFATYITTQETNKLYPEWNNEDDTKVSNLLTVLDLDSLKSSHPISLPIGHPDEIEQIFDDISYQKGSYILLMMNQFLGEETFRTGVSNYLKRYAFKNAEQDDLWESLTDEAHRTGALPKNMTIKAIMDTWTLQTGYPVLNVRRDAKSGLVIVEQARYLAEREDQTESVDNTTWWVPLTYTTSSELDFNNTVPRVWLPKDKREVAIDGIPDKDWILFNIKISSLYRINYDAENWRRLAATLNSGNFSDIHVLNRVQLLDDSLEMAKTGDVDYSIAISILSYLKRETEYLPWMAGISGINYLDSQLLKTPLYGPFKAYLKDLIGPLYNQTANEVYEEVPSNLHKIQLQDTITSVAYKVNYGGCRAKAVQYFRKWMETKNPDEENPVPKEWRSNIYCYAIKEGGEEEWNFAWKRYLHSNVGAHKNELLSALACTREAWLLSRYLRWALDENSGIKLHDSSVVFSDISDNILGYYLAKQFFMENISDFYKHHRSKSSEMAGYFSSLVSHVTTESELNEYINFSKKNTEYLKGAMQSVNQSIESAKVNVRWQRKFYRGMANFWVDSEENIKS